jgi:hypothetical protein
MLGGLGLVAAGLVTQQWALLVFAALPLLIGQSALITGPHIHAAVLALNRNIYRLGRVVIEVGTSSDSSTYHAVVRSGSLPQWRFEFVPIGWSPTAGEHDARFYELPGMAWPALIELQEGVLYPRTAPRQV